MTKCKYCGHNRMVQLFRIIGKPDLVCANCGKDVNEHFIKLGGRRTDKREMCYQDSERKEKFKPECEVKNV